VYYYNKETRQSKMLCKDNLDYVPQDLALTDGLHDAPASLNLHNSMKTRNLGQYPT